MGMCIFMNQCVCEFVRARVMCGVVDRLSAQVNLTLSGHASGVYRPARRALSHQQH